MTSKEALETVKDYLLPKLKEDNSELGSIIIVESVNVLEKLVECDTPMKPKMSFGKFCYVCNSTLYIPQLREVNFCPKCGQKIDWSE